MIKPSITCCLVTLYPNWLFLTHRHKISSASVLFFLFSLDISFKIAQCCLSAVLKKCPERSEGSLPPSPKGDGLGVRPDEEASTMSKSISAPELFPIQFVCMSFMASLNSMRFKPSNNLSAYSVILKYHWRNFFFTTGYPPRSLTPFTTSSFASTVPNASHQFTSP